MNLNPFDQCSVQYSTYRPDYPPELIETVLQLTDGLILDVGAGTGKASAPLISRGREVISLEPSLPMIREGLRSHPLLYVCATAEELPIATSTIGLVICAQAFHWFETLRALREFSRVLQTGGHVCLFWNTRDLNAPVTQVFETLIRKWNPEHILGYDRDDWGDRIEATGLFDEVQRRQFRQILPMTIESWIGLSRSISYIQSIGPENTPHFESELREQLLSVASIDCPYITRFWTARRMR